MHTFIFLVLMTPSSGGGIWDVTPMPNTDVCIKMLRVLEERGGRGYGINTGECIEIKTREPLSSVIETLSEVGLMAEYQLSFDGFVRLFFAMVIIICGYGYVIIGVFIRDSLSCILMLFGLTGLSALFSLMVFMDKNMWAGSPDLTLSVITGFFTATVIFYMFYVLIYSFERMGAGE